MTPRRPRSGSAGTPRQPIAVSPTATAAQAELAARDPDRLDTALKLDHTALAIRADHGLRADLPDSLEQLAYHGTSSSPSVADVRLSAAAHAARKRFGLPRPPAEDARWSTCLGDLRAHVADEEFDAAWAEGEQLTLDEAVRLAHIFTKLGVRNRTELTSMAITRFAQAPGASKQGSGQRNGGEP